MEPMKGGEMFSTALIHSGTHLLVLLWYLEYLLLELHGKLLILNL
jgi:hypothetical protein